MKAEKIVLHRECDNDADISFLGEYTDTLEPGVIVREHNKFYEHLPKIMQRDPAGRFSHADIDPAFIPERGREYRGFIPYAGGERHGTKEYYRYGIQDFKRAEDLNRGVWCFLGIYATCRVNDQVFRSRGVWGIESDSKESYLKEVEAEEILSLKSILKNFGIEVSDNVEIERKES